MYSPVEQEIRELIRREGRITFARFMQACLYSPRGGFYSSRAGRINAHFGTAPTSHPAFGALIARQMEQMWQLLGNPTPFYVVEVGSGDGALARSIAAAAEQTAPGLAGALRYVASDYAPWWPLPSDQPVGLEERLERRQPQGTGWGIQRVKTEGLQPFRNVAGCILCNELLDNFPVHRFTVQAGRVREVFVALEGNTFTEVLDDPSTPRIEERLAGLGAPLPEGFRGEVNLAMEDWLGQVAATLDRGFVLTIDYGGLAEEVYSPERAQGTLVCFNQHAAGNDPYRHIGQQDITALVDFTSLMRLGEQRGLATVGYALQRRFLTNLGFASHVEALEVQDMSYAHKELRRMALMTLVDPEDYGDFKMLAQAKGIDPAVQLLGFN